MKVTNYLLTGMILQVWDGTLIHGTVVAKKGSSYERLSNKSFFYSCAIYLWLRVSPKNIKGIKNDIHQGKSRWHSYHVLVDISPVLTYLLWTVPCTLTMGYLILNRTSPLTKSFSFLGCHDRNSNDISHEVRTTSKGWFCGRFIWRSFGIHWGDQDRTERRGAVKVTGFHDHQWIPNRSIIHTPHSKKITTHPISHTQSAIPRQRQLWKESRLIACW